MATQNLSLPLTSNKHHHTPKCEPLTCRGASMAHGWGRKMCDIPFRSQAWRVGASAQIFTVSSHDWACILLHWGVSATLCQMCHASGTPSLGSTYFTRTCAASSLVQQGGKANESCGMLRRNLQAARSCMPEPHRPLKAPPVHSGAVVLQSMRQRSLHGSPK